MNIYIYIVFFFCLFFLIRTPAHWIPTCRKQREATNPHTWLQWNSYSFYVKLSEKHLAQAVLKAGRHLHCLKNCQTSPHVCNASGYTAQKQRVPMRNHRNLREHRLYLSLQQNSLFTIAIGVQRALCFSSNRSSVVMLFCFCCRTFELSLLSSWSTPCSLSCSLCCSFQLH